MDNFTDDRDIRLLDGDRYTFFILKRIMGGKCRLLLTDHERLIICYTGHPFPAWIWTADDATEEEMKKAYMLAKENSLLDGKHPFNLKYGLAEYFIRRAAEDGLDMSVTMNMFAYDCPEPVAPEDHCDGNIYRCMEDDVDELTDFIDLFHREVGIDQKDRDGYRADAVEAIESGNTYFWKNEEGKTVASCRFQPADDTASVNLVLTHPEHRRKHYAENLVYQVTMKVIEAGFTPMLYTNADYVASNACYEKIGYVLRGKLCTIG